MLPRITRLLVLILRDNSKRFALFWSCPHGSYCMEHLLFHWLCERKAQPIHQALQNHSNLFCCRWNIFSQCRIQPAKPTILQEQTNITLKPKLFPFWVSCTQLHIWNRSAGYGYMPQSVRSCYCFGFLHLQLSKEAIWECSLMVVSIVTAHIWALADFPEKAQCTG